MTGRAVETTRLSSPDMNRAMPVITMAQMARDLAAGSGPGRPVRGSEGARPTARRTACPPAESGAGATAPAVRVDRRTGGVPSPPATPDPDGRFAIRL